MRSTSVILVIAIILLAGCKPKSQSSLQIKTDSSNSSNKVKMPDIGDLKNNSNNSNNSNNPNNSNNTNNYNNSNNSSSGSWSKTYRDKFVEGCVTKASEKVSQSEAYSYCSCMATKVEAKYPNESTVDNSLTSADIETMRVGCLPNTSTQNNPSYNQPNNSNNSNNYNNQSWSVADQNEFMDNCTPGASKSLGASQGSSYCDCMLRKLMREYPNSKDVGNVSKEHMSQLASECLGK